MALRDARLAAGLRQRDAGERAGVAQSFWSPLERGLTTSVALETLAAAAAAVGLQIAAFVEAALPGEGPRPRSIDVTRASLREAAVVEVWDLLVDGGEALRGLEAKVAATRERLGPAWQVQGLLLLRRTSRNRQLVRDLAPLIRARYPASSAAWLAALAESDRPMPDAGGFAWTSVRADRLIAARLG